MYHLARNQEKQEKLHKEVEKIGNRVITADDLSGCHYVKAVLKETLRLNPVAVGIGRLLEEDAIFSNYHVPKGVNFFFFSEFLKNFLRVDRGCNTKPSRKQIRRIFQKP